MSSRPERSLTADGSVRLLLFTGKGGAGTTTCAAATAAHAAAAGHKTLLVATGPAGSLADVCGLEVGGQPVEIAGGLYAVELGSRPASVDPPGELQRAIRTVLPWAGDAPMPAIAGLDDLFALFDVAGQAASGRWDAIVVDCGPSAQAVRALALPAALSAYLGQLAPLPPNPRPAGQADPTSAPQPPAAQMLDLVTGLHGRLRELTGLLGDVSTSVRLLSTAHAVALAEARRTLTALSLHGYAVDRLIANRVDPARAGETDGQHRRLTAVAESFAPRPTVIIDTLRSEPVGVDSLRELASMIYRADDPLAVALAPPAVEVDRSAASFILSLGLPFVERDDIDLLRRGDELVVTVQGQRRSLLLPSALRRCVVTGATLADATLRVEFVPDPDLWVRS